VDWQLLGQVSPARLHAAREQTHWAAQVLSAAGETLAPHLPDTSHTAMQWDAALAALVGQPLGDARLALRLADLTLLLLEDGRPPAAGLALPGRTLAEACAWAAAALAPHTGGERALVHPGYALPPHPIAQGGRFELAAGLGELARWYANADRVLRRLAAGTPGAGDVLCWPHHFDIASLLAVEADAAGEAVGTLGVGLSPGDEFFPEPYWYVNHGPETQRTELPPLAVGEWVGGDWTGAVLHGATLVAAPDAAAQRTLVEAFLASAVPASRDLALEARAAQERSGVA
jgi:hypothetical protein